MIKKIVFMCLLVVCRLSAQQPLYFNTTTIEGSAEVPQVALDTYAGQVCGWLVTGGNTPAKTLVSLALAYAVAYALVSTVKKAGSTAWTWWKGEQLTKAQKEQIEAYVVDMMRQHGQGHLALRRAPHAEDGTCMCTDCSETRRVRP